MGNKKWRITYPCEKKAMLERKSNLRQNFWDKLSLKVDKPKQGGFGNTNTGNTARHAFSNVETFSVITGFDLQFKDKLNMFVLSVANQFRQIRNVLSSN